MSDELIAELTFVVQAKGLGLQEWVTILVKRAIDELPENSPDQTGDS